MAIKEYLQRVFPGTAAEFLEQAAAALRDKKKMFIVTANPEILMHAEQKPEIRTLLLQIADAITPDGISVVRAMRACGLPARERITGVDLAEALLKQAGEEGRSVFLLGAKEEVVSALAEKLKAEYPKITVQYQNGYDGDKDEIFKKIAAASPDLVLVALGVPAQELLIARHIEEFTSGVLIGVGGSFDVLSGKKQRAPALFVKTNTEWLYRILREPSRLKRFWQNNIKFLGKVKKETKQRPA